jgi:hypothetical protein
MARQLKAAGLSWKPRLGDRFAIPDRDLDDEMFVLSNMTIQVHDRPEGRIIGFNGTTEWALDDVEEREAVWLPRLDQLLELLGPRFVSLTARSGGHVVRVLSGDLEQEHVDVGATDASARALLSLLERDA